MSKDPGERKAVGKTYFGVLFTVVGWCEVGSVGDFILELRDACKDMIDGLLTLSANSGQGLKLAYLVSKV